MLHGWRASTIDVDLKLVPDDDALLRAMPRLKEEAGLVDSARLMQLFVAIESQLYRYPAVDPASFRRAVESFVAGSG